MTTWRERIASALKPITEIDVTALPPEVVSMGSAWPAWSSAEPSAYGGPLQTWAVLVALPNADMQDTVEASDPLVTKIMNALTATIGEVLRVEPITIATSDGADPVPGLRFTLTTVGGAS